MMIENRLTAEQSKISPHLFVVMDRHGDVIRVCSRISACHMVNDYNINALRAEIGKRMGIL